MITNKQLYIGAVLVMFLAIGVLFTGFTNRATAEIDSAGCTITSQTAVAIGNQISTEIVATTSNRAILQLQQVTTAGGVATSSVFLGLNGVSATVGNGLKLASGTPELLFGRATDFPYTGRITAITDTASTTLLVTHCLY